MPDNIIDEVPGPVNALISLPLTTRKFEANGRVYHVEDDLSIERYQFFQRMEIELGYSVRFSELTDKIRQAYDLLNDRKDADAAVVLYGIMEGSVDIAAKKSIGLYVATLYINRSDEDRSVWSQSIAEDKLKDWANFDVNFFLTYALSRVRNFSKNIREISELIQSVGSLKAQEMMSQEAFDLPAD